MCLWHDKCSEPHLNVRLSLSKSARHSSWWLLHPWSWSSPLFAAAPSDYSYTQVWRSLIFLTGCQHQNHQERRLSWHFHTQISVTNCSLALLTPLLCICPIERAWTLHLLSIDWGVLVSDLYTSTNSDYLLLTWTPLMRSPRYSGLQVNFWTWDTSLTPLHFFTRALPHG